MQVLEIDKPLPIPYRPLGEVPIYIRRNGPKIQPLPIVDGHIQDPPLQHLDCIKPAAKAKALGATVVTGGGEHVMGGEYANGHWVQPTIWTGLRETARVIKEEVFGPCCHIAPFDTEDEVLAKANDNEYGLATAIWTRDVARAHRVAQRMQVGLSWVNSWFLRDLRTPFGGAKQSGIGREGGVHSLEFYTELKNVCIKL